VNTLGCLEVRWEGRALEGTSLRKTEALLIYLALNPGQQGRSRLAGLLWGDLAEDRARGNLRHALWGLRRMLDAAAFESDRHSVGLSSDVVCQVDALQFEAEIERAAGCRRRGEVAAMLDHLEAALALYQGDFLKRFDLPGCPEFDEWVMRRRVWLRERALEALTRLTAHYTRQGAYDEALRHARRQVSLDPWREEAHRDAMRLLALTGQGRAALAQYATCRHLLETELGLKPLEETTALYERLMGWETESLLDQDPDPLAHQPAGRPLHASTALPFTGRGQEHASLIASWEATWHEAARLALVEGEAGVGKTRLVDEVVRYASAEGATVLRGRCYEFAVAVPYQPIAQALRSCLSQGADERWSRGTEVRGGRGPRKTSRRTISSAPPPLGTLPPVWLSELSRLLPELRQMYPDLPEPSQVSGEAARQRLFEAVAHFLKHVISNTSPLFHRAPCLLFLDDLHWADPSTLDLLHYLMRQLSDTPIWVVGTYRPEEVSLSHRLTRLRQGLSRDHLVEHLALAPLSSEAVEVIACALVGEEQGGPFGDFLYRESEGNPFILTETVSSLQEQGALGRIDDGERRWEWTGLPEASVLTAGVRDVVLQRVGRLSEAAQRLLSLAAVVGWRFDALLLRTAAGRDADTVDAAMDDWLSRHLVQPRPMSSLQSSAPDPRYDFSHDKIRAVVYDAIEITRRRRLHRRVAQALERQPDERMEAQIGLLAHHWDQAEELEKAADYHVRAGDQARLVYAHQEAIEHYRWALRVWKERGKHERAARTLMKLGLTHHNAFDFVRARRAYDEGFAMWRRAAVARPAPGCRPTQVLRVRWVEPTTLDPALVGDSDTDALLAHLFSGLVDLSAELDVVPAVARAWEMSEGGRRFVFRLRKDALWSDGMRVTAGDFEYAWKRVLDPVTDSPKAAFLYDLKGARAFHQGEGAREDVGVRACDDVTLAVELESPVGYFLQLLTHVAYAPVPRHLVENHGEGWTKQRDLVANGPFRLEAWEPGQSMILVRSPTYYGPFRGNLERVEVRLGMDWSTRLEMYESGGLDVLGITYFPAGEREGARQRHAEDGVSRPRLMTCYVAFDVSRPPFDDARVRRAFAMAVDRKTLASAVLQGYVSAATGGFVPPGMPGHSPEIGLSYDPERARRLLADAGFPRGRDLPVVDALTFLAAGTRARYLEDQWRDVLGAKTRWDVRPWAEFLDKLGKDPPRILILMWVADYVDPDNFLRVCRARTWPGWRNQTYDRLVEQARRMTDQQERLRLYRQADRILVDDAPILPLTYEKDHLLVKPWVSQYPTSAMQTAFWKDAVIEPH
jgi:ABC-type oligopeptide transport system substrate-binding subunit/DNA-binding SARP family transcriptional activator